MDRERKRNTQGRRMLILEERNEEERKESG